MLRNYLLPLLLSIILSPMVSAKQPLYWVTESWPNFTETNGNGLYHEIISSVFEDSDFSLEIEYAPWKRALHKVEYGEADMTGALPDTSQYYASELPIMVQAQSVLFKSNTFKLNQPSDLSKLIGTWPKAYEKELITDELIPYVLGFASLTREAALKVLVHGRADYYFDANTILSSSLTKLQESEPSDIYNIKDIGYLEFFMVFNKSEKGLKIKSAFDEGIKKLSQNGTLSKLYEKYNVAYPY